MRTRSFRAAAVGRNDGVGQFAIGYLDVEILPRLMTASSTRSTPALVRAVHRMVAAVCADPPDGRRNGLCQSLANQIDAAEKHYDAGRLAPARNVYESVASKIAAAGRDGTFTAAEVALASNDLAALLTRLPP